MYKQSNKSFPCIHAENVRFPKLLQTGMHLKKQLPLQVVTML